MTLADEIAEWDAYYAGSDHPHQPPHRVIGENDFSRWWRKFPQGLRTHGGDSTLDTPLCYEINRLEPPVAPPDHGFDRLLARWYGEGWEER